MKKILLAMTLAIATTMGVAANDAHAQSFSSSQMQQTKVRDLSFKSIMRALYARKMLGNAHIADDELSQFPNVVLDETSEIGESVVALMHPVIEYEKQDGQKRYLIAIEKPSFDEDGNLVACHVCDASVDLYIFKESPLGGYELVSRTPDGYDGMGGSWGRSSFNSEDIAGTIQPLGKSLMGSLMNLGYCSTGVCESVWLALHLLESNYIGAYYVGDGGTDTSGIYGEDSPLAYSYESTPSVVNNGATYYPIRLHFVGDMPIDESGEQINYVDFSQELLFNPIAKEYQ